MSNYTKATNFAAKDALPVGDASKKVKGVEVDNEFNAISNAISTKADSNSPTFTGTPSAPTAAAGTSTTQIATTAFVTANSVPAGAILLWSGSVASIPTGFVICDGTNSTPDLRNRFVVGAGSTYAVDATGGSADAVVVQHNHTATSTSTSSVTDPGHNHTVPNSGSQNNSFDSGTTVGNDVTGTSGSATTGISVSTSTTTTVANAGESGTNKNLPPYYALAYIMKT